jgi:large conductance mechanosensitive channel
MFQGFKQFMLRGNVLDLAVAVVMGAAFGAVVTALVKDLITPLIAAIIGEPDFSAIEFTVNGGKFLIGDFINAVVSFLLIGAAVYFFIVPPVNPRACGGASRRRTRPPRNARNVSAMYRSQHAAARSARPRSPNPRSVLVPLSA